jgi:hypothetical protein
MNYKILDNALNENSFHDLQKYFFSSDMTWYYNNTTIDNEVDESYYFSHWMYKEHQIKSNMFESVYNLFNPILDLRSIFSIRANLTLKRENKLCTSWHTDVEPYSLFNGESVNFKTAIFYLNTNNGSTFLDKEKKYEVEAVSNRLIIFDASVFHCNEYSSNTKERIVLNFNYA